jgi:hypothetical protein
VDLVARFFRLLGVERRSKEDRAAEALAERTKIGDKFRNALENPAGFLGCAPEQWGGLGACGRDRP